MHVLVVHNRYASAQPSGENKVVDQEVALLRGAGHRVEVFERRSDDIAARSLLGKVAVPLLVPWNPAVRAELAARLRTERPDVVHVHNVFPLLSPAVLAACADAGVPAVATLHNYTQVCPPGTLQRDGRPCTECVGSAPLPAVRHGCYRSSRLATVPLAVSLSVNRRLWWSGVERFFCISAAQRDVLVRAACRRAAGGEAQLRARTGRPPRWRWRASALSRPARGGQGRAAAHGRVGRDRRRRRCGRAARGRRRGAAGARGDRLGGGPGRRAVRRPVRPGGGRQAIARSIAVVAPSTWLEAFGLVVVEAMAAGVPAVAAGHGAFVELVEDGVTGLLHRPGEPASLASCLRRITAETARNREMGQATRRRYEQHFSPAVGLERLMEDTAPRSRVGPAAGTARRR